MIEKICDLSMEDIPLTYKSFTREELLAAFNKVQDKKNWKNPIKATVPISEFEVTEKAIEYFTGTPVEIINTENNMVEIYSCGYYLGPCN